MQLVLVAAERDAMHTPLQWLQNPDPFNHVKRNLWSAKPMDTYLSGRTGVRRQRCGTQHYRIGATILVSLKTPLNRAVLCSKRLPKLYK